MPKQCKTEGCTYNVFSKGLCQQHWRISYQKPITPKKVPVKRSNTPIKKISAKQAKLNVAYSILRQQFLKDHPYCQARIKCLGAVATQVHHKRGRGEYMLDTATWMSSCHDCHEWIETRPLEAKELGLSENRLDKYDDRK